VVAAALGAMGGCGRSPTSPDDGDAGADDSTGSPSGTSTPSSVSSPSGQAGTGQPTGLPCDIQGILENRCIACHGPTASAANGPPPLLSYDQLIAPSNADPKQSRAQLALAYMKSKTMPPPPAVAPEDDEIAAFQAWVDNGTPKNPTACTDPPPPAGDAGTSDAGSPDAGAPVCTSNKFWKGSDDDGNPLMHPGRACNACHQKEGGPNLRIAGTVFPTAHEPDDCDGAGGPPQLTIIVTDAKNQVHRLTANSAGNFLTTTRVTLPIRAQVTDGTKVRNMNGSVTSGDCNSCHTVNGLNGAPGRIMAP
jgi:mono/diheme cytochrome c family protein